VNFKGQEIKRIEYPFNVLTGDDNTNQELRPDNKYYLSGKTLAVSCRGCEAIREPVCYGKPQDPSPPIPTAPTPPVCTPRDRSSSDESDERIRVRRDYGRRNHDQYGRRDYRYRSEERDCKRCGQCTAGVEIYRFGDPEFAIDGGVLSTDIHPPTTNHTCRGCRSGRFHEFDDDIVERNSTLEQRCFTDGGSKEGSDFFGGSFFFICDTPQDMCVCALRRDGRLENDGDKHGRKRACYGVSANAT